MFNLTLVFLDETCVENVMTRRHYNLNLRSTKLSLFADFQPSAKV